MRNDTEGSESGGGGFDSIALISASEVTETEPDPDPDVPRRKEMENLERDEDAAGDEAMLGARNVAEVE